MKKNIRRALLCALLFFIPNLLWGETITLGSDWNALFGTSYIGQISSVKANALNWEGNKDGVNIKVTNGTSQNGYVKTDDFRAYGGYTIVISSSKNITGITSTKGGKTFKTGVTANVGKLSISNNAINWSGSAKTITLSITGTVSFATISVVCEDAPQTYKVSVKSSDDSKGSVFLTDEEFNDEQTATSFTAGTKLGVMALAGDGYEFVNWTLDPIDGGVLTDPNADETVFTVGNKDVTITANFQQIVTRYDIVLDNPQDPDTKEVLATIEAKVAGSVADKAAENEEVALTLRNVEAGYELDKWVVLEDGDESKPITVADNKFTMPAADVMVSATLKPQMPATIMLSENGAEKAFAEGTNYYVGSQITLPTTAGGNCNKSVSFVGWSDVEITKSAAQPTANFYAPGATYTIQNQTTKLYAVYAKTTEGVFRKVTTTPTDWSGEYLIVYEEGSVVFNGSLDGNLDAADNNRSVTIDNNTIALADGQNYTFTIAKSGSGYTLQSKSGYYIGGASENGIICSKTTANIHTLSLNASNATIKTSDKAGILRFNTNRFRYYKNNTTGKPVALYVKENGSCYDYSTTCMAAIDVATPAFSVAEGTYSSAQIVEITCTTSGAKIYYTTDGKEPTNASTPYTGAITVDKSMIIKAIAYVDADNYSDVATATYSILQDAEVKWQTYGEDGSSKVDLTEATIYTDDDLEVFVQTLSTGEQTFTSTDPNVATVEMKNGLLGEYLALNVKGVGTTTITVNVAADDTYAAGSASFVLHVQEPKQKITMLFAETSYTAKLGETFAAPALTVTPAVTPIVYSSSDANVATVDATTGDVTILAMGVTTIKAEYAGGEVYDPASAQYTLQVVDPNADVLTADKLTATDTNYKIFTGVQDVTGTLYAGNTAKDSEGNIQLRSKNSISGIVSTSSMGFVKSITITFAKAGNIDVYGNTSAYTSAAELYATSGNGNQGIKLVTLSGGKGETVSLTITDAHYPYIGIRSQSGAVYLKEIAIAWAPTSVVRAGLAAGQHGTICLKNNVTAMLGASFYEIAYREDKDGTPYRVCFDEVSALEAGVPYIFLAEDEQITVVYGDETATEAKSKNGLVGTFAPIKDDDAGTAGNVLEGNYLINGNMIRRCGGNCSLSANRAYICMEDVPTDVVAPAPGRRRITMQNADAQVTTGLNGISEDTPIAPQQQGIYDVLGRRLEQTAGTGFYIVNGKKQVIVR